MPCSTFQFCRRLDSSVLDSQCLVSPHSASHMHCSVKGSLAGLQPPLSPQLDTMSSEQPAPLFGVALGSCGSTPNLKWRLLLFQDDVPGRYCQYLRYFCLRSSAFLATHALPCSTSCTVAFHNRELFQGISLFVPEFLCRRKYLFFSFLFSAPRGLAHQRY